MDILTACCCCLLRPPDKNLRTSYTNLGKSEIYAEMLKECFKIHMKASTNDSGICEACVFRLREALNFKRQVQRCQKELQVAVDKAKVVKDERPEISVKLETMDDDNDDNESLFYALKEELAEVEDIKNDPDDKISLLAISNVKPTRLKKKEKRKIVIDLKKHNSATNDRKTRSLRTIKLTLRGLDEINKSQSRPVIMLKEGIKHKYNIKNILKYSNCTPFTNRTLNGYLCGYCKDTFPEPQDLRDHTHSTHKNQELVYKRSDKNNLSIKMDIKDLKCNICNVNCNVIESLKRHLSKEHDVKFYPDVFDYIMEFKLENTEMLNCALCHSSYETFKMLLQHMNGHYRNYICDACDMGFINKHRLTNHKRTHEVGSFKCTYCDKVFSTKVRRMCHEKYTHNTSARYTTNCPHCDATFTSYYQRNRHMVTEHNAVAASYKCNICEKSFIMKSKLTSHIKKVHLMERNHICPECGQGFFIKQSLDEHMIRHGGERVHKCMVCQKAYARKKTLREHMRIHNNDRRFKCGICALAFVQKCSLKSHMLSNHGVTLAEFENFSEIKK